MQCLLAVKNLLEDKQNFIWFIFVSCCSLNSLMSLWLPVGIIFGGLLALILFQANKQAGDNIPFARHKQAYYYYYYHDNNKQDLASRGFGLKKIEILFLFFK